MRPTVVAALLVTATACGAHALAAPPDRAAEIRTTVAAMSGTGEGSQEECLKGLAQVVRIAGAIARDGGLTGPGRAKLDAAVEALATTRPLEPAFATAIGDAYAALNDGRAFVFPAEVKTVEQARTWIRALSESSVAALGAGHHGEAARDLLGCVLAVITPQEAQQ